MKVVLRCEATSGGGVGHLVRCLALVESARARGWTAVLSGTVDAPVARRLVEAAGLDVVPAPATPEGLAAQARDLGADLLHVDDYGDHAGLRALLRGPALSSIEDGTFGRRPADVVVDSTLGAEHAARPDDGSGTVLLGVRYAPLRASVRAARDAAPVGHDDRPPVVLVVMGGTDPFGATAPAARLALLAGAGRVVAVTGSPGGPDLAGVEVRGPVDDLPALAAAADVVVSAAGTSVWELACVGVPQAIVAVTENQRTGYARATGAGVAVGLGGLDDVLSANPRSVAALADLLTRPDARDRIRAEGRSLVDGLGADRVVDAWDRALGRRVPVARRATADDGDLLLSWRNDPAARASSRTTDPVDPAAHRRWMDAVLASDDRLLLVLQLGAEPVGTARFDRVQEDLWEVSITLAPDARGRGLAAPALAGAESAWRALVAPARILACVRPENVASVRLFEGAGYRRADRVTADGLLAFEKS